MSAQVSLAQRSAAHHHPEISPFATLVSLYILICSCCWLCYRLHRWWRYIVIGGRDNPSFLKSYFSLPLVYPFGLLQRSVSCIRRNIHQLIWAPSEPDFILIEDESLYTLDNDTEIVAGSNSERSEEESHLRLVDSNSRGQQRRSHCSSPSSAPCRSRAGASTSTSTPASNIYSNRTECDSGNTTNASSNYYVRETSPELRSSTPENPFSRPYNSSTTTTKNHCSIANPSIDETAQSVALSMSPVAPSASRETSSQSNRKQQHYTYTATFPSQAQRLNPVSNNTSPRTRARHQFGHFVKNLVVESPQGDFVVTVYQKKIRETNIYEPYYFMKNEKEIPCPPSSNEYHVSPGVLFINKVTKDPGKVQVWIWQRNQENIFCWGSIDVDKWSDQCVSHPDPDRVGRERVLWVSENGEPSWVVRPSWRANKKTARQR
ncbi:hypothetical protein BJ138DRAFT_1177018 [Hygrophoropsis aurantiaca]|uniref:Uncharacterized protein n=1 Tax=Hygrophoropsis aurantiaca TaxID=72124 RepID=A0ACB8AP88_9AGAM|nr:hypothetical protein BJ138DRAFT_1177018 [Hygrophoropsis aurantiaca]